MDKIDILLVEDNPSDAYLVERAFRKLGGFERLHIARDGVEALAFLRDPARPRPAIVLTDLNVPKLSGLDVLAAMKADPALRSIPVIVLTGSQSESDVLRSFDHSCAGYFVKPTCNPELWDLVELLEVYWLRNSRLPL